MTWGCLVAPLVGAWIEIAENFCKWHEVLVAPLVGAWIEISEISACTPTSLVAPLVGAWIEIMQMVLMIQLWLCRSSRGSVD